MTTPTLAQKESHSEKTAPRAIRKIVGMVVFDGEKFLLLHRVKHWRGWEFPKGEIEKGESTEDALRRELFEETGLREYELISFVDKESFYDKQKDREGVVDNYLIRVSSNSVVTINNAHVLDGEKVLEHDGFRWYLPEEVVGKVTHKGMKETMKKAMQILGLREGVSNKA